MLEAEIPPGQKEPMGQMEPEGHWYPAAATQEFRAALVEGVAVCTVDGEGVAVCAADGEGAIVPVCTIEGPVEGEAKEDCVADAVDEVLALIDCVATSQGRVLVALLLELGATLGERKGEREAELRKEKECVIEFVEEDDSEQMGEEVGEKLKETLAFIDCVASFLTRVLLALVLELGRLLELRALLAERKGEREAEARDE